MALQDQQRTAVVVRPKEPSQFRPVLAWAVAGGLLLAFELFVLLRWISGSHFDKTDTGPDAMGHRQEIFYVFLQIAIPLGAAIAMYYWVVKPWRREGRLTTDGMIALSAAMLFFWDMCMNYTSVSLLYNSNFVNYGAWANGSWPGWTSPNADELPEPIFVCLPGYTSMAFVQVVLVLWILRRIKAKWPDFSTLRALAVLFFGLIVTDTIVETILIRMEIYAYPGGIRELTLFAGETYQLPMTEPIFFGGFGLGAIAALSWFRDDKGRTVVERGMSTLKVGARKLQYVKFFAIFGAVHMSFLVFYFIPCQWLATHADEFPDQYPSYMINEMCNYEGQFPELNPCPGPGVPMPRP